MSESGGISWGKVLMGAAVVTTAVAAAVFLGPDLGTAIEGASKFVGNAIGGVGNSVTNIGSWISEAVKKVAEFGAESTANKAIALGTAAAVGAAGVAATTSFVDRINRSTAPITGRE